MCVTDCFLNQLPFYNVTNLELNELNITTKSKIEYFLKSHNLLPYLKSCLPDTLNENINCKYYHECTFNQQFASMLPKFSLFHINIRSFSKHRLELQAYLNTLNFDFQVIALTETGKNNVENNAVLFNEYSLYHDPPVAKCGGAGLLVHEDVTVVKERPDLKLENTQTSDSKYQVENTWLELKLPHVHKHAIVGVIYRHPNGKIETFNKQFEKTLEKISKEDKYCFICGDLNLNALNTSHAATADFLSMTMSENIIPHITLPTRITERSATLIDHILVKHDKHTLDEPITTGNLYCDITDHLPNFILFGQGCKTRQIRPMVRIFGEKNIRKFQTKVESTDWNILEQTKSCNDAYNLFAEKMKTAYQESFPLKRLSRKKQKDKKWLTQGIKNSIKTKHKLHQRYLDKPIDSRKENYKRYKNILTSACRTAEERYYKDLLSNKKSTVKHLWDIFGPIINPQKRKKCHNIDKLVCDGKAICDNKEIANAFNNYFVSIGSKLSDNQHTLPGSSFADYMDQRNDQSMFVSPATENELRKVIQNLKGKKAAGYDEIAPWLVKTCQDTLIKPLLSIVNRSFQEGVFPSDLKIAKVIPIYKKGEKTQTGNYRPISLLNCMSKIIEKLMHSRLYSFLKTCNLLYRYQFGFRAGYSTTLALIEILDNIHEYLDNGYSVFGIYLDLTKAFDTVNHDILIKKMDHYGVRGLAKQWFESYLKGRKQFVSINGSKSDIQNIKTGVPQGSVLGPLLFLIYVNDIPNAISDKEHQLVLFADDTNVFLKGKDLKLLKASAETTIRQLKSWFIANKLTLSLEKTQYNLFHTKNKQIPPECDSLDLADQRVMRVQEAKYLGVIMDEKLSWNGHVSKIHQNLIKYASSFKVIKNYLPKQCAKQLFTAHITSKIQYGIEVYGHTCNKNIKKLQVIQNRIIKTLFQKEWRMPTNDLHKELNLLKVTDIFKVQMAQFTYKCLSGQLPDIFNSYYITIDDIHHHRTRAAYDKKLYIRGTRTVIGSQTAKIRGAKIYNNLRTTNFESSNSFRQNIIKAYIDSY